LDDCGATKLGFNGELFQGLKFIFTNLNISFNLLIISFHFYCFMGHIHVLVNGGAPFSCNGLKSWKHAWCLNARANAYRWNIVSLEKNFWEYEKTKWVQKKCWELLIQVMKVNFLECLSGLKTKHILFGAHDESRLLMQYIGSQVPFPRVWRSVKSPMWMERNKHV
jgi:hypothetical protein